MIYLTVFTLIWVAGWVYLAGLWFTFFQDEYPHIADAHRARDRRHAWFYGAFGPLGIIGFFLAVKQMQGNLEGLKRAIENWRFPV